jgi:Fe-S-cluster containining protein
MSTMPSHATSVVITNRLLQYGEKQSKKVFHQFKEMVLRCRWPWTGRSKVYQAIRLHKEVDKFVSDISNLKCRKGCANCCLQDVAVSKGETELIWKYLKKHKREIPKFDGKKCGFLNEDKSCSIYEVRPATCRNFISKKNPVNCLPGPKQDTGVICLESEILTSAYFNKNESALMREIFTTLSRVAPGNPE